jgi:hypothetical protein
MKTKTATERKAIEMERVNNNVNKLQISRNTHLRREKESKMNRHGEDQIS